MGIFKNLFKKKEEDSKPKNDYKDLLEKLADDDKKELIWFLIGSLISADTLTSIDSCKNSISILEELGESIDRVSDSSYTQEEKDAIKDHCIKGLEICRQDLEMFEKGEYPEIISESSTTNENEIIDEEKGD